MGTLLLRTTKKMLQMLINQGKYGKIYGIGGGFYVVEL